VFAARLGDALVGAWPTAATGALRWYVTTRAVARASRVRPLSRGTSARTRARSHTYVTTRAVARASRIRPLSRGTSARTRARSHTYVTTRAVARATRIRALSRGTSARTPPKKKRTGQKNNLEAATTRRGNGLREFASSFSQFRRGPPTLTTRSQRTVRVRNN